MRRTVSLLIAIGLLAGLMAAAPAEAAKKKKKKKKGPVKVERTVEFAYECPCTGSLQLGSLTGGDPNLGGGPMAVGAEERYLVGEAVDRTGLPIAVSINQDVDGDGFNDGVGEFCGKSEEPMEINPGLEIRVFIGGQCEDGTPTTGAGGNITFTISNLP